MKSHSDDVFIGRTALLDELGALLDGGTRLVTLVGPGGVGKSTLAGRLAAERDATFVALDACSSTEDLVAALAGALPDCRATSPAGIAEALTASETELVILDNVEQIAAETAACLEDWLPTTTTTFVTTTRVRLGLPEETSLEISPLDTDDAVELFVARARLAARGFEVTDANRGHIRSLVGLLEGLPLAIELAASRVRVLAPRQIEERLERRIRILRNEGAVTERHRTLHECIAWSWKLLDEVEQSTLAQVQVFLGAFTMEDAEAIVEAGEWVGEPLTRLVEHSLLRVDHVARKTHFMLYDSVRRFLGETAAIPDGTVARYAEHLSTKGPTGLERRDLANIRNVFELLVESDAPAATDLILAAHPRLIRSGFVERILSLADAALKTTPGPIREAKLNYAAATAHYVRAEFDRCDDHLDRAAATLDAIDTEERFEPLTRVLLLQAVRAAERLEFDEADTALERARANVDRVSDTLAANTFSGSGSAAMKARDFESAARFYGDAYRYARRTDDILLKARAAAWSGFPQIAMGDAERAIDRLQESLDLFSQSESEDFISQTQAQFALAQVLLDRDRRLAVENAEAALELAKKSGAVALEASTTTFLARVTNASDAPEKIRRAIRVFGDQTSQSDRWSAHASLIVVHVRRGELDRAQHEADIFCEAVERLAGPDDIRRARQYAIVVAALLGEAVAREDEQPFAEVVAAALEAGSVSEEALASYRDPHDRMMLDFAPLPLELLQNALEGRSERRKIRLLDEGARAVLPDGTEVDLESRYLLQRLLLALCEYHARHPGEAMPVDELVEAGWPDEEMTYDSGVRRVYSAIRNLRKLGLADVLLTGENGYLVDPELDVELP